MKLYIKNMVCSRCKMVVKSELENLGLHVVSVELGEVEIEEADIAIVKETISKKFNLLGFKLIATRKVGILKR